APDRTMKIRHDWPGQLKTLRRVTNVVGVISDRKFPEMYAHDVEAVRMIFRVPALQDTEIADAIDARELPKVDQQNLPAIALNGMWHLLASHTRVDPLRIG